MFYRSRIEYAFLILSFQTTLLELEGGGRDRGGIEMDFLPCVRIPGDESSNIEISREGRVCRNAPLA